MMPGAITGVSFRLRIESSNIWGGDAKIIPTNFIQIAELDREASSFHRTHSEYKSYYSFT